MAKRRNPTVPDAAQRMLEMYQRGGNLLRQQEAAITIAEEFGDEFSQQTSANNATLSKEVREAFECLTPGVVFDKHNKVWRPRESGEDASHREARSAASNTPRSVKKNVPAPRPTKKVAKKKRPRGDS